MESNENNNITDITFKFGANEFKGLKKIIYEKSLSLSFVFILMTFLSIYGIQLVLSSEISSGTVVFSFFLFLFLLYVIYNYFRTIIEIRINHGDVYIKAFLKFKKFYNDDIRRIYMKNYPYLGGYGKLQIKTKQGFHNYTLHAAPDDPDRYQILFDLKEYLESDNLFNRKLYIKLK